MLDSAPGFPELADGWLKSTAGVVRKAGGLLICDEVQSSFGRIGSHFWAHQKSAVVPDIVTLGKPMANGHPVGDFVTSTDIMAAFRKRFRYFNTFGGNPVSCAAAMAVLDEMRDKNLMKTARTIGDHARMRLRALQKSHPAIGDRRGSGLVFGAEMVLDRQNKASASAFADRVINMMRARGVLLSKLGWHKNTLKIQPPMPFSITDTNLLFDTLDAVLTEIPLQ